MELRNFWSYDPKFKNEIVENIQGKYSFRERPQTGILLTNSSGNQVQLAADNFQGHVISYVALANVDNFPGIAIEWVREDVQAIQRNQGYFPSEPGVYYVHITEITGPERACRAFTYFVDPLLEQINETVMQTGPTTFILAKGKFVEGALRLYRMADNAPAGGVLLQENVDYTADPATGEISLILPLEDDQFLSADYKYPGESIGPLTGRPNFANNSAIPGCVLAFGRRIGVGDRQAIIVSKERGLSAMEYGGRWDLSLDFEVIARDVYDQREILDRTAIFIWGVLRSRLSTEGIEIQSINLGGESEQDYNSTEQSFYYNATFNVSVQTDWSIQVPAVARIVRVEPLLSPFTPDLPGLGIDPNFEGAQDLAQVRFQDPFYNGKGGRPGVPGVPRSFPVIR